MALDVLVPDLQNKSPSARDQGTTIGQCTSKVLTLPAGKDPSTAAELKPLHKNPLDRDFRRIERIS